MASLMRAKLFVSRVEHQNEGTDYASDRVTFAGVSRNDGYPTDGLDENNTYAKFSPSVELNITIANPALVGKYERGETYYVDFTPVEGEIHG